MKTLLFAALLLLPFINDDLLTGRWESRPSNKGNVTGVVFKKDSTTEVYVNRKPFVSGRYRFNSADSTLSLVENGCNGVVGIYKVLFFSDADSMRFKVISDSCTERANGMQQLVMGRVQTDQAK